MSKFDYKTTTSTKFLFSFFPSRSLFLTIQEKKKTIAAKPKKEEQNFTITSNLFKENSTISLSLKNIYKKKP